MSIAKDTSIHVSTLTVLINLWKPGCLFSFLMILLNFWKVTAAELFCLFSYLIISIWISGCFLDIWYNFILTVISVLFKCFLLVKFVPTFLTLDTFWDILILFLGFFLVLRLYMLSQVWFCCCFEIALVALILYLFVNWRLMLN